ncbi:MAG TPA: hypothetical protein VH763_14505 [Gemmatimonadales bacterium]
MAVSVQAVPAYTWADPVPGDRALGELRVLQPMLMLHAGALGHFQFVGTLDLEGATIPQGELALGNWGEGFVDRRHPHTYAHELLVSLETGLGGHHSVLQGSLTAGKGFAPFGTDDPMVRPGLVYPVNHHLSQILERWVGIAALRAGAVTGEVGLFDGDEPERPGQWPRLGERFGDSWSARLTGRVLQDVEIQGSHAKVHSPEHRPGAGTDQLKWSLSARWGRPIGRFPVYGLVEWARTSEAGGFFVFHSLLAEGAWTTGQHRLHLRWERTDRPEEVRVSNFRSLRPHLENSILGITRWTIETVGYQLEGLAAGPIRVQPLAEISHGHISKVGGGLFNVIDLYGKPRFWSFSVGLRIAAGAGMHRMGRYGVAQDAGMMSGMGHHHH